MNGYSYVYGHYSIRKTFRQYIIEIKDTKIAEPVNVAKKIKSPVKNKGLYKLIVS